MAAFKTHLLVGSAVSAVAATSLMAVDLATPRETVLFAALGTAGGLLPDIDADGSVPVKLGFSLLAILAGFAAVVAWMDGYTVAELGVVWLAIFGAVRFGLFKLFTRFTVHRGVWHSVPAGVLSCFLTAAVLHRWAGADPLTSWLGGTLVFVGYLTHLILDELSSVDLLGVTCQRSFGSALKLFSLKNKKASTALYAATSVAFLLTPPAEGFVDLILSPATYEHIRLALLPAAAWFVH